MALNSHKELVKEVLNWGSKMEMINEIEYVIDHGNIDTAVNNLSSRGFAFAPVDMGFDDEYNTNVMYGFTIVDKTTNDINATLTSEQENMFCVSALHDFINRICDGDIVFEAMNFDNVSAEGGVTTSISGTFTSNIKRSASYWKVMEEWDEE